ncbi:MAG: DUF3015 family protein [bacterium]
MSRKASLIIFVLLAIAVLAQPAAARPFADIYVECGLGAMIAPNHPAIAVITNITWDLGSTAISSDISSPENCKGGQEEMASFIYDSYEHLETDLARGQGVYLDLLMVLADETEADFVDELRGRFAALVADEGYSSRSRFEKAESLYNIIYPS